MEEIMFSVVVPVYNVERYLDQTVRSVLPQLRRLGSAGELLLIDDGSTDGSGKLCDEYAKSDPDLVRVFHKDNEGLLLTRRFGFRLAKGKYIVNCDSDDTLEPDALQCLKETVKQTDADVVIYNLNTWDAETKAPFSQNIFPVPQPDKQTVLRSFFQNAGTVSMCAKAFKRSCLDIDKDYGAYYKKSFGEDTLQSAEIYTNARSFYYINKALYNYRADSGMTGKMNPTYFQDFAGVNAVLETYESLWKLENFGTLVAEKVFTNAARAVTQSRFAGTMTRKERIAFMTAIRQHTMFRKYQKFYPQVRPMLKRSYQLLLNGLMKGRYGLVDLLLRLKNLLSG